MLRHAPALFLVLLLGCATGTTVQTTSWLDQLRGFRGPTGSDVVQLDVALLELPPDDPFLSKDVWLLADEQTVSLERKAVLEDNGFRVGQIGGIAPAGLQKLLTSENSCVKPRRLFLHAGDTTTVALGPAVAHLRFQLVQGDGPAKVSLEQAEPVLSVLPTLTREGQTRLQFTPQIRYGEKALAARPAADGAGLLFQEQRPVQSYATLGWDVTLAPNQYVLVGARTDRPGSLGYQIFLRRDEPVPVQRLLVVRTGRAPGEPAPELASDPGDEEGGRHTVPLALQAAWTTARGRSEDDKVTR